MTAMISSKKLIAILFLCLVADTYGQGLYCRTIKGQRCAFPFIYKGVTHNTCTKTDSVNGAFWCATELQPDGRVVNQKWEDCNDRCPRECLTKKDKPCVFPFTYKGEVYNQCTQFDSENGAYWCATKVDRTGKVVRNAWEDCQSSCPTECVRWVDASDGDIPAQAFKNYGQPEYVVRARHEGGIYPGTFLTELGEVDIPWRDQVISKSKYQVMVENSNQNCDLQWLDVKQKKYNKERNFNQALVIGGHDSSLNATVTATYICRVQDPSRPGVIGKFNTEEEICYIPVGDKVHPFSGDGIQILTNINSDIQLVADAAFGDPPRHLSGIGGLSTITNAGWSCSNTFPCQRSNEAGQTFCCEATFRNRFPSCRRVKNCKVLQSGSANQVAQESCKTTSGASVNKPCVFPFKYRGVEYNRCTLVDSSHTNNKAWCSTEVDSNGNHVGGQGKWGNCGPACPR